MLYVGIDVAKRKHDCCIMSSDGEILSNVFSIENKKEGFEKLLREIESHKKDVSKKGIKIGLEATGHYSNNIVNFLERSGLSPVILNPLCTNLNRKGHSLRKTKTDKVDAMFITKMLITGDFEPTPKSSYHISELKSLSRHRFRFVEMRTKLKISYDRMISILFPELEGFVCKLDGKAIMNILLEFPGASAISTCNITRLANLAMKFSRGMFGKSWAYELRELARNSIGINSSAKEMELQQIIRQILLFTDEIELIEKKIKTMVDASGVKINTIPGINYTFAAIIISEIGDITRFETPAKLQAFAGLEPSTYSSGQYIGQRNVMVKRGSKYLRWALIEAAGTVSRNNETFGEYLSKKLSEGKHYKSAMGHVAKKLLRTIYKMMLTGEEYIS